MKQSTLGDYNGSVSAPPHYHDTTCPTCGDDSFSTAIGMRRHHAYVHGESLSDVDLTCDNCDAEFTRSWGNIKGDTIGNFCSRACNSEYQLKTVDLECSVCGTEYTRRPSELALWESTYCSRKCRALSPDNFGMNHPRWNGGGRVYNLIVHALAVEQSWGATTERARERADYRCEQCGRHQSNHHRALPVHHCIPVFGGGSNGTRNLKVFCDSCHAKADTFAREHIPYTITDLIEKWS